jgi:hypothetical protein
MRERGREGDKSRKRASGFEHRHVPYNLPMKLTKVCCIACPLYHCMSI